MTLLRTLRALVFGETWLLPLGLFALVTAGALLEATVPAAWKDAGGPLLVAGLVALIVVSVTRGARPRRDRVGWRR